MSQSESAAAGQLQSQSPPLHLTTSKVMVIVWRLRGILPELFYIIANVLPLQWTQLTKTVGPCFGGLHDLSLCSCMLCFALVS